MLMLGNKEYKIFKDCKKFSNIFTFLCFFSISNIIRGNDVMGFCPILPGIPAHPPRFAEKNHHLSYKRFTMCPQGWLQIRECMFDVGITMLDIEYSQRVRTAFS